MQIPECPNCGEREWCAHSRVTKQHRLTSDGNQWTELEDDNSWDLDYIHCDNCHDFDSEQMDDEFIQRLMDIYRLDYTGGSFTFGRLITHKEDTND